ncbi:MAG: glycosyltransferase family 2 protein [Verrucomicrobiota bacterium]
MILDTITPVILTWNEAPNIGRCLENLSWARRIVVVDSGSTDGTTTSVSDFSNTDLAFRTFDNHTDQWNFGIDRVDSEWVLSLDADYMLTQDWLNEIRSLEPTDDTDAFYSPFAYKVFGKTLAGSLYPARAVLFRKSRARYKPDGHTQLLDFCGESKQLTSPILHDDRKSLARWINSQQKYAELEAQKLMASTKHPLSNADRIRQLTWLAPILVPLYCLVIKRLAFQGKAGMYYSLQRTLAEVLLSLNLLHVKLRKSR